MRIAFIGIKGLPSKFGADRVVEAIVERLSHKHEITVYCSSQYIIPGVSIPGIKLIPLKPLPGKYSHMTSVDLLAALHAVLIGNYDLIHLHHFEASFILPILKLRYKVISTAHGRITSGNKWGKRATKIMQAMEAPFVWWSDAATSVSFPLAEQLELRFKRHIHYIPNGIDPSTRNTKQITKMKDDCVGLQYDFPDDYLVFAAGRILPLKGAHLLLEAYRNIESHWHLLIIGDLSYSSKYADQLKSLADSRVTFLPFIASKEKLHDIIRNSRLFVFPSLQEGMSMMLLEAASTGVPILQSDIPANLAVLPSQAIYFHSGDMVDLTEKLRWASRHTEELKEIGKRSQLWVFENYNWDVITSQYEQLYQKLVCK